MSNFKARMPVQERLGRTTGTSRITGTIRTSRTPGTTRVEYVNRHGDRVDPKTGKPFTRTHTVPHIKNNFSNNRSGSHVKITARRDSPRNVHTAKVATHENGTSRRRSHLPIKTQGTMFGGLDPVPEDPTRDPPPRVCYNCWQPGHARRQCPRPITSKVCNNCGRRGEDLSTCPRCSRAHKEYLFRLQARERGELLEPSEIDHFLSGDGEDQEEEYDDVLKQIIYRDKLVREQMMFEENPREPLYTRKAQEDLLLEAEEQAREEEALLLQREREREEALFLEKQREREAALFLEERKERERRERERDRLEREKERERRERERERRERESREPLFAERERCRENQERRIAELIHNKEPEKNNEWSRERSVRFEYSNRRPENSLNAARRSSITPASSSDLEAPEDPVKEILELTKSISHLSPETQEMIMRQVMAERKEKVRLRAGNQVKEREMEREPQRKWEVEGIDDDPWA